MAVQNEGEGADLTHPLQLLIRAGSYAGVGPGVQVGAGVGVGVSVGRGGTSVTAALSPMLMTTSKLTIKNTIRVRRALERCTRPPINA